LRVDVLRLVFGIVLLAVGIAVIMLRRQGLVGSLIEGLLTRGRSPSQDSGFPSESPSFPVWGTVAFGIVLCLFGILATYTAAGGIL
jgi:hypothetical protein